MGDEEEEFYSHSSVGSLPKLKNSRDLMEISGTRGQPKFENSIKEHMYRADGSEQKDSLGLAATITTPTRNVRHHRSKFDTHTNFWKLSWH